MPPSFLYTLLLKLATGLGFVIDHRCWRVNNALSTAPRPDLPQELIYHILDELWRSPNSAQDLSACALVCKSWTRHAQRRLFHDIKINSRNSFFAFEETVSHSAKVGTALNSCTQALAITLDFNLPHGLNYEHILRLSELCSNLRRLAVTVYGCASPFVASTQTPFLKSRPAPSPDPQVMRNLASNISVQEFTCSNWSTNEQITLQFLELWPRLKRLQLRGNVLNIPEVNARPPSLPLETLDLVVQPQPSAATVRWLLDSSKGSLQRIRTRRLTQEIIEQAAILHGDSLKELVITNFENSSLHLLQRLKNIEYIHIDDPFFSIDIFQSLPPRIKHLSLKVSEISPIVALNKYLASQSSLDKVTIRAWSSNDFDVVEGIRAGCKSLPFVFEQ